LLEVLDALKAADVDRRARSAATTIYQALIEAALTAVLGAALHERTEPRTAQRSGSRPRDPDDHRRRSGAADPDAARRLVLPLAAERRRRINQV